jgi:hypothetical protein
MFKEPGRWGSDSIKFTNIGQYIKTVVAHHTNERDFKNVVERAVKAEVSCKWKATLDDIEKDMKDIVDKKFKENE